MLLTLSKNDFLLVLFGFSFREVWILCFAAFLTVWLIKSKLIALPFLDLISGVLISVSLDLADVSLTFILCISLLIASKNLAVLCTLPMSRSREMASEIPEIFYAAGPQRNAFMSVRTLLKYFRRKLLQLK